MPPREVVIARVDDSQKGCVEVARGIGAYVFLTHTQGHGFPDAVVAYRGRLLLVEFKTGNAKLTEDEQTFHQKMQDQGITVHVIRNPNEMLALLTREDYTETL